MQFIRFLALSIFILQINSSAIARDDLSIDDEKQVLKKFIKKWNRSGESCRNTFTGMLIGSQIEMPGEKQRLNEIRNTLQAVSKACHSMANKAEKASRHCAVASDQEKCSFTVMDVEPAVDYSILVCCSEILK